MVFFLVYSISAFRRKQPRNLTLNGFVFFMSHTTFSFLCVLRRAEGYFFLLYDCYALGYYRRSKYNYQKMFYIWHSVLDFNRKFTSDCPIQHLWNCPFVTVIISYCFISFINSFFTNATWIGNNHYKKKYVWNMKYLNLIIKMK